METVNGGYRVSCWKNVDELRSVYKMIFDSNSTIEDKTTAYRILLSWKVRRSQETLTGILCTLALLDVQVKDESGAITDPFTLSTLYASTITKFINYATSFQMQEITMYRSAYKLGIDSFLIDLRHLCAHGKNLPNIEVFRKSHRYCLNWIRKFFWESELENVSDATAKNIRFDTALASNLSYFIPYYDLLVELLHKNIINLDDAEAKKTALKRWPILMKFMQERKFKNFRIALKFVNNELSRIIESKTMSLNPQTFILTFLEKSEYFFQTSEVLGCDGASDDESGNLKQNAQTIVNLYQKLIWQLTKYDHLKLLLDSLMKIALNSSEKSKRRESARFWTNTLLKSFSYYQRYCDFAKNEALLQKKISDEVRKVYNYQFDADLGKVFIFVGTQLLPTSLKYSRDYFMQLLSTAEVDDMTICMNLMPFVHPKLSDEQLKEFNDLVEIKSRKVKQKSEDKIYSIEDLMPGVEMEVEDDAIWQLSTDDINWSSQPIGVEFAVTG